MDVARRAILTIAAIALVGCGGTTPTGTAPAGASTPAPGAAGSPAASPVGSGPAVLPVVHGFDGPMEIPKGTYVAGPQGFFPGLGLTLPDGWTSGEADSGELKLWRAAHPDELILLWKDVVAVVPNNQGGKVGQVLPGIGRTSDALLAWLAATPDFAILEEPMATTIAGSIKGTQLTVGVSAAANFAEPGCPDNPRCAAFFTDPSHWPPGEFWAIGGKEVGRVFIATLPYPDGDHTFFVTLDAPNPERLAAFAPDADAIINTFVLPATFVSN